ncbi:hypothetical protein MMC11_006272 [Xylographa trunciseda]|nr:hypothetical protein [Xylographa trunciseda]
MNGLRAVAAESIRVLACVRCHQRKLRCDRKFPCANCVGVRSNCVPTPLTSRQRRRRFPERDLLDRIRRYEGLLQQHNIAFEPLHGEVTDVVSISKGSSSSPPSDDAPLRGRGNDVTSTLMEHTFLRTETLNLWKSLEQQSQDSQSDRTSFTDETLDEDIAQQTLTHETTVQRAMDQLLLDNNNHLLFLAPNMDLNLSCLHPPHAHIFKLWQIYLGNVDPLLKVTHTPTLQASIVDVVSDIANIEPTLEALMFGVYCVAVLTCTESECLATFNVARTELLAQYQIACREALLRCTFLHSQSRNCLTALYLYLNSIKPEVDRRSLCAMLGTAVRIAQRLGIHTESANTRCSPFEAEMRRRLWWSLVLFDARVCEGSNDLNLSTLIPIWDCKTPSNLNDFEIRPEMKSLLAPHEYPTEALYVVMRTNISQHIRHSDFHLDFINPALKTIAGDLCNSTPSDEIDGLTALERMIDSKYLDKCDPDNPLHFVVLWTARSQLAKSRLIKHYWACSRLPKEQTDGQWDEAMSLALTVIECEAILVSSLLSKNFGWHFSHFQFLAHAHIIQDLTRRPTQTHANRAWNIMSDDFRSRFQEFSLEGHPIFMLLANSIIKAWKAYEEAVMERRDVHTEPWIVHEMKRISSSKLHDTQVPHLLDSDGITNVDLNNFLPMPLDPFSQGQPSDDVEAYGITAASGWWAPAAECLPAGWQIETRAFPHS